MDELVSWDICSLSWGKLGTKGAYFPLISAPTEHWRYIYPLVCAFFVALLPVWVVLARRSPATREVLYSGWEPVIIAMAISRYAGALGSHPLYQPHHRPHLNP